VFAGVATCALSTRVIVSICTVLGAAAALVVCYMQLPESADQSDRERTLVGWAGSDRVTQRRNNLTGQSRDEIFVMQPHTGGRNDAERPAPLHPQPTVCFELRTDDAGDISLVSGDRVHPILRFVVINVVEHCTQ
jgi:hypothetical protein